MTLKHYFVYKHNNISPKVRTYSEHDGLIRHINLLWNGGLLLVPQVRLR